MKKLDFRADIDLFTMDSAINMAAPSSGFQPAEQEIARRLNLPNSDATDRKALLEFIQEYMDSNQDDSSDEEDEQVDEAPQELNESEPPAKYSCVEFIVVMFIKFQCLSSGRCV